MLALMTLTGDRERETVEYIFSEYYPLMYRNAYAILQNRHDAEDAVMDAFLRIVDHAEKFSRGDREELVGLVVIYLRNAAKSIYRRRKRHATLSLTVYADEESFEGAFESDEPSPLQALIDRETAVRLEKALETLPEEQRDALLLRHYYEHSYEDIAAALGISEMAVRARVYRAKNKLKEIMGDEIL